MLISKFVLVDQILHHSRRATILIIRDIDGKLIGRVLLRIKSSGNELLPPLILNIPRWIGSFPVMIEARVGVHIGDT